MTKKTHTYSNTVCKFKLFKTVKTSLLNGKLKILLKIVVVEGGMVGVCGIEESSTVWYCLEKFI